MVKTDRREKKKTASLPVSKGEGLRLPPDAAGFPAERVVMVARDTFIEAGAPTCFEVLTQRLEEPAEADPVVLKAQPAAGPGGDWEMGSTTRLTVNLGKRVVESPAVITAYQRNRTLSWVLANHPKVKEYWHLDPEPGGTRVRLTLGQEVSGSALGRFWQTIARGKELTRAAGETLARVKEAAETTGL